MTWWFLGDLQHADFCGEVPIFGPTIRRWFLRLSLPQNIFNSGLGFLHFCYISHVFHAIPPKSFSARSSGFWKLSQNAIFVDGRGKIFGTAFLNSGEQNTFFEPAASVFLRTFQRLFKQPRSKIYPSVSVFAYDRRCFLSAIFGAHIFRSKFLGWRSFSVAAFLPATMVFGTHAFLPWSFSAAAGSHF